MNHCIQGGFVDGDGGEDGEGCSGRYLDILATTSVYPQSVFGGGRGVARRVTVSPRVGDTGAGDEIAIGYPKCDMTSLCRDRGGDGERVGSRRRLIEDCAGHISDGGVGRLAQLSPSRTSGTGGVPVGRKYG